MIAFLTAHLWPWLLAAAIGVWAWAHGRGDARAVWVAAWCAVGVTAMQMPIGEPARWLYAATLWTFITVLIGLRRGNAAAAAVVWIIPAGYAGIYLVDDLIGREILLPGTGWRDLAFGVTEAGFLAALIVGGRRLPRGNHRASRYRRNRVLAGGRSVAVEARPALVATRRRKGGA